MNLQATSLYFSTTRFHRLSSPVFPATPQLSFPESFLLILVSTLFVENDSKKVRKKQQQQTDGQAGNYDA